MCASLLPHALTASGHAEQLGAELLVTSSLLNRAAGYLYGRGELAQARPLFERALDICEAHLDPGHLNTATTLDSLGNVLHGLGELSAARTTLERALAIREAQFGPDHPNTVMVLENLASVLVGLGARVEPPGE